MLRVLWLSCWFVSACKGGAASRGDALPLADSVEHDASRVDAPDATMIDAMIDGTVDAAPDAAVDAAPDALVTGFAQRVYLKASNTGAYDQFSVLAISADGSTLAIGAPYAVGNSGAVYVFARSGSTWTQQAYLNASNPGSGDMFGWSIALSSDGSTMVVGAYGEDSNASGIGGDQSNNSLFNAGAAYVFVRSGSTWAQTAYVKASNTNRTDAYLGNERFGYTVSLSADGTTMAIAADYEDGTSPGVNGDQYAQGARFAGAVYVFVRTATSWTQQAYVKASNPGADDVFGRSIALSADGSTMAVGAKYEASAATGIDGNQADNTASESGAVYVFTRTGTQWSQQAYVKASNTDAGDYFGSSVALSSSGSVLAVGAYAESSGQFLAGAAYMFERSGTTWTQRQFLKASNITNTGLFALSLALSADGVTLAVGSPGEASAATGIDGNQLDTTAPAAGAVYMFSRGSSAWTQTRYVKAANTNQGDWFGTAVALAADGGTLAVSAAYEDSAATGINGNQLDNSATDAGAAYVFYDL